MVEREKITRWIDLWSSKNADATINSELIKELSRLTDLLFIKIFLFVLIRIRKLLTRRRRSPHSMGREICSYVGRSVAATKRW